MAAIPPIHVDVHLRVVGDPRQEALRALVDEQAEDEGLWFVPLHASEAYLQQELRRLHEAVEVALGASGRPRSDRVAEYLAERFRGGVTNDPAEDS